MSKKYSFQNLLEIKDNTLSGALSPLLFAQEVTKRLNIPLYGLCRVRFEDTTVHNRYEAPGKREQTSFDTLIIASRGVLVLFVDEGIRGIPVAMWFVDENTIELTPAYIERKYTKKLTPAKCLEILKTAFAQRETKLKPKAVVDKTVGAYNK